MIYAIIKKGRKFKSIKARDLYDAKNEKELKEHYLVQKDEEIIKITLRKA
jgi:hypothetical protein